MVERPAPHEIDLCHYLGHVKGKPDSTWAAVSTCNNSIHGVINDGHDIWHLEHVHDHETDGGQHFLYKHSDMSSTDLNHTCGYRDPPTGLQLNLNGAMHRVKRDILNGNNANNNVKTGNSDTNDDLKQQTVANGSPKTSSKKYTLKGPWNSNRRSRYVELVLVVDNMEFNDHGKNLQLVYRICKDVANVMNALYSSLNIYIALVGVVVWTEFDEISLSTNGDTTLNNFLHYRKERLVKDHPNDNAQLLTGIQFEGGVVGKALKGPICTYEFSGGVNMWHSDVVGLVATTVAHEMGHNFGMVSLRKRY